MKTSTIALVYLLSQHIVVDAQLANVPIKRRVSSTTDRINDSISSSSSSKQHQRVNTARLLKTTRLNKARLLEDDGSMSIATDESMPIVAESMSLSLEETTDSFAVSAGEEEEGGDGSEAAGTFEEVLKPVFTKASKATVMKSKVYKMAPPGRRLLTQDNRALQEDSFSMAQTVDIAGIAGSDVVSSTSSPTSSLTSSPTAKTMKKPVQRTSIVEASTESTGKARKVRRERGLRL